MDRAPHATISQSAKVIPLVLGFLCLTGTRTCPAPNSLPAAPEPALLEPPPVAKITWFGWLSNGNCAVLSLPVRARKKTLPELSKCRRLARQWFEANREPIMSADNKPIAVVGIYAGIAVAQFEAAVAWYSRLM